MGQTINVGSSVDLNNAILTIDSHPNNGYTLNLINGFTMGQQVPGITSNSAITISGNSNTIDGANLYQPLTLNSGTVTLQNLTIANTSQPITVNGGTLIDTTGSLQGAITNNAAVQFNTATSDTYGGNMSGTGHVEISGTGIVTFSGLNAYTGGTTVDSGSQLTGTTDSLQGPINNNWLVQFNQAVNGTYAGNISGTGGVEISGAGAITFSGTNSYSTGTVIDQNSTLIGTTSSLQGTFFNAGIVQFNQSTNGTFAGNMEGGGSVEISGGGTLTFSGLNIYEGGTTVDNGSKLIGTTTSLQGSFTNNGLVQFNQSTSGVFAGNMAGTGGVEISGGGPMTFTGTNSYSGGTTLDSGNVLIGTTVSLQGAIINNGAIQFNQTTLGTYSGNMSGSGQVEISGVGPVSFTGDNSYSGGTTVDIGSTLIGTATGLQGAVTNNGLIQINPATSGTYRGNMSGTGSVEIESGGAITFTGLNTYSGGTTVDSGGTLIGSTTSLRGTITNNGLVEFQSLPLPIPVPVVNDPIAEPLIAPDVVWIGGPIPITFPLFNNTYSGNMSGTGSVEITGQGTTVFANSNSYTGGTTVDSGSTLIGNTASLQGNFINNGAVIFNGNIGLFGPHVTESLVGPTIVAGSSFFPLPPPGGTFGGNISGTGSVEIAGNQSVTFSGTNSYTGGTIVDGGNALIGTTSSLQGVIGNSGVVEFDQSWNGIYSGNLSGTGGVQIDGGGLVTFSGSNNYTGGTNIGIGSTLIGTTNSLQGAIVDNGLVQFNQTTGGTYAGIISGAGGVEIGGVGPITFSGTNTYTGGTSIDNGSTLVVGSTGTIAGIMNVNNGGTLQGQGVIGSTNVNAGGTINPGIVGAPLTINGNFNQGTGSTYSADLSPLAGDKIAVTGTALIGNGTTLNLVVDPGTYTVGTKYEILAATGGLNGAYSSVLVPTISQNILFSEKYNANNLQVIVNSNLSGGVLSSNQAAVAAVIDQTSGSATGNYANAITQLTTLSPGQLSGALNQLSGDIFPSISTIARQTTTAQMQLLSNRLATLTGPGIPRVATARRTNDIRFVSKQASDTPASSGSSGGSGSGDQSWTSWAQGYGLGGNIGGDGNAGGTSYRLGGTLFGVERWLGDNLMVGVLGGYAGTSVSNSQDGSTAQITAYQAGLYELYREDLLYISNIDAFTNDAFNVSRPLTFGTIQQTASASSSGNQWAHYTEAGTTFEFDELRLQPFLGMQYMYLDQQGYTESGAGSLDMTTGHQIVNSVRNGFGARLIQETMWGNTLVTPSLAARYQHEWGNGTQLVTSSFSGAPTLQFATSGNHTGRDFALLTLGATAYVTEHFSVYGMVDTQLASNFFALIGSGGIQYSW